MKMHILSGGRLRMRKSVYLPDAGKGEMIDLPAFLPIRSSSQYRPRQAISVKGWLDRTPFRPDR